jgi:cytochrome c-type biogenesis protein CcmH/NrfG
MALTKRSLNFFLAGIVALLAAAVVFSIYSNSRHPVVQAPLPQSDSASESAGAAAENASVDKLAALEEMISKDPKNAQIRTQLGNFYYDLGQYQKAIDAYQESLRLQPDDPNVETDEATCYHYLGQNDKALEILNRVLGYRPNFPQAMFNKGIVLIDGNKSLQDGISIWEDLLRTNPDFAKKTGLEDKIKQLRQPAK